MQEHAIFDKVIIRKNGDNIYAVSIDGNKTYKVISSDEVGLFLIEGVVCNAMICGGTAYIVRCIEQTQSKIEFSPEYIAKVSKDRKSVLILRPLKEELVWVSSKKFTRHLSKIEKVISSHGLYMLGRKPKKR